MEDLLALIGGLFMDAVLKALNYKIEWGFSYDKNPLLPIVALITFCFIPISLFNNFGIDATIMFSCVFCLSVFFMVIIYCDYEEVKEESTILDDDLKNKKY